MNTDPLTEAELARVLEPDARFGVIELDARWDERAAIAPRLARELLATREKLKVAREALEKSEHHYLCAKRVAARRGHDPCECNCGRDAALTQLNQP